MSLHAMNLVWDATHLELNATELLVLLKMADIANDAADNIYPGVDALAQSARASGRTVQRILRRFEEAGIIAVVSHEHGGRGRATCFRLVLDRLARPVEERATDCHPLPAGQTQHLGAAKGDTTMSPIRGEERVTPGAEKGDTQGLKGDTAVSPQPINPKEPKHSARARDPFDLFREAFPPRDRPEAAGPAREIFEALVAEGIDGEALVAAARVERSRAVERGDIGSRYIVTMARWLRERRFDAITADDLKGALARPEAANGVRQPEMPPPAAEAAETWARVRNRLRGTVGIAAYRTWIKPLSWQGLDDGRPVLVCLDARYRGRLAEQAGEALAEHLAGEGFAGEPVILTAAEWAARTAGGSNGHEAQPR